jgi:16S rRNA C967 or C1407 C5-methylase (RsmB/RsmF family)
MEPAEDEEWNPAREYELDCPTFDKYYKMQFKDIFEEGEFDEFKKTLLSKLPVTFRVNSGLPNYEKVVELFKNPDFISEHAQISETSEAV